MMESLIADGLLALVDPICSGRLLYLTASEQRAEQLARLARCAFPDRPILHVPASDAIPGEASPASPANAGARVAALHSLVTADPASLVMIASAEATAYRYAAPAAYAAHPPEIRVGMPIDLETLQRELTEIGYRIDERIDEPGEVGAPGNVLDVFAVDADCPVRIEVEDGKVRSLRLFDPLSQRSLDEIERVALGRASEPAIGDDGVSLLAHMPEATLIVEAAVARRRQRSLDLIAQMSGRKRALDRSRYVDTPAWEKELAGRSIVTPDVNPAVPRFVTDRRPMRAIKGFLKEQADAGRPVLIAGSERDIRFFSRSFARELSRYVTTFPDLATALAARPDIGLVAVPLDAGIVAERVALVAAADIIGRRAERADALAATVTHDLLAIELRTGDAIVHEDHGVAILKGLRSLPAADGGQAETIELEYAKQAIRHVPVADAARLWRYGGEPDAVTLDTLDGKSWAKRRPMIDAAVADTAKAIRALARDKAESDAPVLAAPPADLERFADGFAFAETADQWKAIEAVRADLLSGKPMDRLIVGDVGFGKTEVALRAAAQAVLAGKQAALIAPTTLLARQHFETFRRRFEPLGIEVAMLSRLTSGSDAKAVKARLADGSLRMVVGTSSLASTSVRFADLALVIIDEEQRFGSAQKDRLARMGAGHVLRLSATPIPRTLQTALIGLTDLSIIATPPARRMPVRTTLGEFDEAVVRAALLREQARAGQSFVVVPRIEDLDRVAALLGKLVPDLTLITVHGKMKGDEAEAALIDFADGEGDILLATSIIETGLDVPRANTMIIIDAQWLGAGQLHQLRGRVGRSSRRAAVLLTTPAGKPLPDRTRTRLQHLTTQDSLGAGFAVSAQDLDMRGAGDLLSDEQSGHMKLVGIELYQHLLSAALRELAGEQVEPPLPAIDGVASGQFPDDWIVDPDARIAAYIRLARASSQADLDALADELEDRYGALPSDADQLLANRRMALDARALGVERVQIGPAGIALTPAGGAAMPKDAPLEDRGDRWLFKFDGGGAHDPAQQAEALFQQLV